jgi:HK97 family phage major capsid protein
MTLQATDIRPGHRSEIDPQCGFLSHREYLAAVMEATLSGDVDRRLRRLQATAGSDEQGEYSGPAGGFLMPEAWMPRALTRSIEDPAAGRTTPITTEAPIVRIAARVDANHSTSVSGGIRMIRNVETTDPTPARFTVEGITLQANELLGVTFASERLVIDSPRTFIDLLERCYQDETTSVLLDERIRGTGTGEFSGVLNSTSLITIAKETGQANDSVAAENFVNMRARCWGYRRVVWIVNPELYPQVIRASFALGTGAAPIWQPGNEEDGIPDRILGRPAYFHECASAIGDVGDVICANFAEYIDSTYIPLHGLRSMHVRFTAIERAYRFYTRNDGAPWWRVPMTPKHSSVTVSPFVTLAAR